MTRLQFLSKRQQTRVIRLKHRFADSHGLFRSSYLQASFRLCCKADGGEGASLATGVGEELFDQAGCLQALPEAAALAERSSGQAVLSA